MPPAPGQFVWQLRKAGKQSIETRLLAGTPDFPERADRKGQTGDDGNGGNRVLPGAIPRGLARGRGSFPNALPKVRGFAGGL